MEKFLPWEDWGTNVKNIGECKEILERGNLNWDVETRPIYWEHLDKGNTPVEGKRAVINTKNESLISIIKDRAKLIQNKDAFRFLDTMVPKYGLEVEKCGFHNKSAYVMAKLPQETILEDGVDPYLIIKNSFEGGSYPLNICVAPIRIVCANQIESSMRSAKEVVKLADPLKSKEEEVAFIENILKFKEKKIFALKEKANILANTKVSYTEFEDIVDRFFPTALELELTNRKRESNAYYKENILNAYKKDDLNNLRGNAWGVFNAFSDFISHIESYRDFNNNRGVNKLKKLETIENGSNILSKLNYIFNKKYGVKA